MVYYDNGITTSTRVFLNAFGFNLKENGQEKMNIYKRGIKGNPVGSFRREFRHYGNSIYSANGYLYVRVGNTFLNATIKANRIDNGVVDNIKFELTKESKKINGKVKIMATSGNTTCQVRINYTDSAGKTVELSLNNGTKLFAATIKDNNGKENIEIDFANPNNRGIVHEIGAFDYDDVMKCYPCTDKYVISGFETGSQLITVKESHSVRQGGKYHKKETFDNQPKPNIANLDAKDALSKQMIYAGNFLYKMDSKIGNSIRRLVRETIVVDNVSVVQNLATMCYEGYEMRGINALLGFTPDSSFYQGGIHSLNEAYFGISDRNPKDRRYSR